jgi:hypothetical protein
VSDVLEGASRSMAFGLDDLEPSPLVPVTTGGGAIVRSFVYFGSEPAHGGFQWPAHRQVAWLAQLADRFAQLSTLVPGWDGGTAPAIDRQTLGVTWDLLRSLSVLLPVQPSVVPTVAGGIALEWHRGGIDLEIEMGPDKDQAYVSYEDSGGSEVEGPLAVHADVIVRAIPRLR